MGTLGSIVERIGEYRATKPPEKDKENPNSIVLEENDEPQTQQAELNKKIIESLEYLRSMSSLSVMNGEKEKNNQKNKPNEQKPTEQKPDEPKPEEQES